MLLAWADMELKPDPKKWLDRLFIAMIVVSLVGLVYELLHN